VLADGRPPSIWVGVDAGKTRVIETGASTSETLTVLRARGKVVGAFSFPRPEL
jgi:hypothetical protein